MKTKKTMPSNTLFAVDTFLFEKLDTSGLAMSFLGDHATKMAEDKAFAEGGYTGLWKFRFVRFAHAVKTCSCCA